jgi:CRISPR-associated endonuclease Cas2
VTLSVELYKINVMKRGDIVKGILSVVAFSGVLTLAMVAPGAVQALKLFDNNKRREYYIKNKTLHLVKDGYLIFENRNGRKVLRLTKKGRYKLRKYQTLHPNKKQKWDNKWRIVVYDVWETNRGKRDAFRKQLKLFGFKKLQVSVWIYPYSCEDFISLLKADKKFGNNVRCFITEKMENDHSLRKMFDL